jgi:hypothetical protein
MNVRYEKDQRERAIREKKFLVTIAVNGKHIGDDSMCIQGLADLEFAKRLSNIGLEFLRKPR